MQHKRSQEILKYMVAAVLLLLQSEAGAQDTKASELEMLMEQDARPRKEFVKNAFKSSRVINGHSMEMIGKGVLDFRILHRFGMFKDGFSNFFGLDQATMRLGFDYGVSRNLTLGIGRSTFNKEYDGFFKYRLAHQRRGYRAFPVSILWVSGITMKSAKIPEPGLNIFTNRLGFYHQLILGKKIGESFTLQLSPTVVHRNLVELKTDQNDLYALGVGSRIKISKRSAFIIDTYPLLYGYRKGYHKFPLSIGFDIETGGHVFQLHITNAKGMNENAFITETLQDWRKGEIQMGFNLSRVFTVAKNKQSSW